MSEQSSQGKIGILWKWVGLSALVVGTLIWAGTHWWGKTGAHEVVTTEGIVKTVVTMKSDPGASAGSFKFDDRASELNEYTSKAYELVLKGQKQEAIDYTCKLIVALDRHIQMLENEAQSKTQVPTTQKGTSSSNEPKVFFSLRQSRIRRVVAELTLANIKVLAGQISDEQWAGSYEKILQTHAKEANDIARILTYCMSAKEVPIEKVEKLLTKNIPADARGKLALWLVRYNRPDDNASTAKCKEFYESLLAHSADSCDGSLILTAYVMALDRRKETSLIRETLENYASLFFDSDVGLTAVGSLVAHESDASVQNKLIVNYYEKYPNSFLAKGLRCDYAEILTEQGKYAEGLATIDVEGALKKAKTPQEASDVITRLAKQIGTPKVPAFAICTKISQDFFERGDYANSIELNFAALKSINALPINLITQRPIRKISEIIEADDPKSIQVAAKYFQMCVFQQKKDNSKYIQKTLGEILHENNSSSFEPYILVLLINDATAAQKWNEAKTYVGRALELLPSSSTLINLQNQIDLKYQQASAKNRIESEQRELLKAIEKAPTDEDAINKYEKLAELYLATNNMEQAIGTYLVVVEKYSKHHAAPTCLSDAISLLEQADKDKYASRIKTLVDRLKKDYPASPEARRYVSETEDVLK